MTERSIYLSPFFWSEGRFGGFSLDWLGGWGDGLVKEGK